MSDNPFPEAACDACDGTGGVGGDICLSCGGDGVAVAPAPTDLVYVFPSMMAAQLCRFADRLQELAKLARDASVLPSGFKDIREGDDNAGVNGDRGTVLDIVERQVLALAKELIGVDAKMPRNDLLAEM